MARRAIEAVDGVGIFGMEMFLLEDDRILINEMAPRPHNSGHYTIEACITSQFENHLRAILGLPLGSPSMVLPAAAMVNLLADRNGVTNISGVEKALKIPGVNLHLYGKKLSRPSRKMGHITVLGRSVAEALERATKAASFISF
jgi:5-(carboxyamino)imidazole ribonucleotide synthase